MNASDFDKLTENFKLTRKANGIYYSSLSYYEWCEKVKTMLAVQYDDITVIGVGTNCNCNKRARSNAVGFIKENEGKTVVLLAGSLIRSINDYKEMHEVYQFGSSSGRFSIKLLQERINLESESIRVIIGNTEYTMIIKDIELRSMQAACTLTYLSHNDHRRRYKCYLYKYKNNVVKYELKLKQLDGFKLKVGDKVIGRIKGSYVIDEIEHIEKPIECYLDYKEHINCELYPFDFIYREVGEDAEAV